LRAFRIRPLVLLIRPTKTWKWRFVRLHCDEASDVVSDRTTPVYWQSALLLSSGDHRTFCYGNRNELRYLRLPCRCICGDLKRCAALLVTCHRRFETTYRSLIQESSRPWTIAFLPFELNGCFLSQKLNNMDSQLQHIDY
jgi:hypothetical protein